MMEVFEYEQQHYRAGFYPGPQRIYERHTLLTELLIRLGVDRKTAAEDACKMEHYISSTSFTAIKHHMAQYGTAELK